MKKQFVIKDLISGSYLYDSIFGNYTWKSWTKDVRFATHYNADCLAEVHFIINTILDNTEDDAIKLEIITVYIK